MNLNQIEQKFKELEIREKTLSYMYNPRVDKIKGLPRHPYFDEVLNDYYSDPYNVKNKAEYEHKWNEMHMDRDNWIESNQLLNNAINYVQKEVLHQKKEGRFILPSSKGTDMSPQHDHHSNRNIGKDMTPTLKQTTINPNKQIEDINESAEFRSSCNPTEFPHSKEGKMNDYKQKHAFDNIHPDDNLLKYELKLDSLQSKIESDEKIYRNWRTKNDLQRHIVRNEAATMIMQVMNQDNMKTKLEQPKLKKIRYLLEPNTQKFYSHHEVKRFKIPEKKPSSIPVNNLNNQDIPKLSDIPRNNYNERGQNLISEMAKTAFNKEKIAELRKSKGDKTNSKRSTPQALRKCDEEKLIDNATEKFIEGPLTQRESFSIPANLQIYGNASVKHNPSESPMRVRFLKQARPQKI